MSIATFLQGVSPFGPIFGKELRTTARRKRTYFLRVIYLALLLIPMVSIAYAVTAEMGRSGGIAAQNQQRAEIGLIFFACFSIFSVFMMGLFGPILTATAISSERLHKTLPVLLMTPITAWQIVAGKLFSRLLVSLTLIGLGLPVLALVRLLGGVELEQMLGVVALAIVAAVSSAAIGLFFSTLLNRAYAVILLSFGTMLVLYAFVPFVISMIWHAMTPRSNPTSMMSLLHVIWAMNPYALVFAAAIPEITARMTTSLPWAWCIGSHLTLTLLLVLWSSLILRRRAGREGEGSHGTSVANVVNAPPPLPPFVPVLREGGGQPLAPGPAVAPPPIPLGYAAPLVKKPRPAREVSDNPILWRELRRPLMARRWQRITGICIVGCMLLIVYGLLGYNNDLSHSESQAVWACIFNFLIAGIALVISSTAIAQEKESDTWTLMLAAPVGGRTLVWGKALGVLRRMLWPMVLVTVHFLVFAAFGVISFAEALMAVWIIITFNTLWIATGVYFSLRFNKVTFAVIANLMLAIAAYLFVWGILALLTDVDFRARPNAGLYRYNSNAEDMPYIDPKWLSVGVWTLFGVVSAWWGCAVFLAVRSKRGAIGHFMIATMIYMVVLAVFGEKMNWISSSHLYRQVGWYAPYYYLGQVGQHHYDYSYSPPFRSLEAELWLPNGSSISGAPAVLSMVLIVGVAHLLAAAGVLSMTAWKFSGLVGRAPQLRKLAAEDCRDMAERTLVSASL